MFDSIIFLILAIFVVIMLFKILKSVVKAMITAFIVFICFVGIVSMMLYFDISGLQDDLTETVILLQEDGNLLNGVVITTELKSVDTDKVQELYDEKEWKDIAGKRRLIITSTEFYDSALPEKYDVNNNTIEKEYLLPIIKSDLAVLKDTTEYVLQNSNGAYIVSQYQAGNFYRYPRSFVFWFSDKLPGFILKPILWLLS